MLDLVAKKKKPTENLDPHWALIKPGGRRDWKAIEMGGP
jgi:hypothetical protein